MLLVILLLSTPGTELRALAKGIVSFNVAHSVQIVSLNNEERNCKSDVDVRMLFF